VEAAQGRIGSAVDQVLLYCYQYDPATGKYGAAVMRLLRAASVATVVVLGGFIALMVRRERASRATAARTLADDRLELHLPEGRLDHLGDVDALYLFLVAVSVFFGVLIAALLVFFAIKYKRRSESERRARSTAHCPWSWPGR